MHRISRPLALALLIFALGATASCRSIYYRTMDALGKPKRDLLVDRVEDARDSQEKAKEQFRSALEQFSSVVNFEGGDLEAKYDQLQKEYDRSEERAEAVRKRVEAVRQVADDLFKEWEGELEQYKSRELRRSSQRQLRDARERYDQLIAAMERAEATMDPVLEAFHDQVLYLKHNLNARAIASLKDEAASLETDIARLIEDMERSIEEANAFIRQMGVE